MQQDNNDPNIYNMDTLQDMLFNRLKNIYLEDDEPYFMINYKPQPHAKCFLTTDDINKYDHKGYLIFPKTFCKKLRHLAEPIQREQEQVEEIVNAFVEKLREEMTQLVNTFAESMKCKLIPNAEPYNFLVKFYKGNYKEDDKLLQALEELIRKWNVYEKNVTLNSIESSLQEVENKCNAVMKKIEAEMNKMIELLNMKRKVIAESHQESMNNEIKVYAIPKSFELIDQVEISKGKSIPWTNGIDIHPCKNVYVAMGCNDGDLVVRDQDTNTEINRINLNNNSGGATQNCLWSQSGDKIMVSTFTNHSIYIYDETGQKLLKSIEKTYSQYGYEAIWLSEHEVAVGYEDGMVKFFNVDEGKEIKSIKMNGTHAWGMDCVDDSHLLVGDYSGSITNFDWKNNRNDWIKTGWHSNYICCLRLNQDKTKLLTSSFDNFVKLMRLQDQSQLWEFKMNHYAIGIMWMPGELYVMALSYNNQLVALNSNDGTKIIEFNGLSTNPKSLRLNPRTAEVLVGDTNGTIRRLKICQDELNKQEPTKILIISYALLRFIFIQSIHLDYINLVIEKFLLL